MWYYMTKYSFSANKHVVGPFKTEEEAWKDMEMIAILEFESDLKNGFLSELYVERESGEIVILNHYKANANNITDKTEFFIFEI